MTGKVVPGLRLASVNIGISQHIGNAGKSGLTGIFKQPTKNPVQITAQGMVGDAICDTKNHGGVDQAVYLYSSEDYAWWENELGRRLAPGTFGENMTLSASESAAYHVGDQFLLQEVILQVTSPRIPCGTLAARMDDPKFPQRFQQAERPGLYCRVIREGTVQEGDWVSVEPYPAETVSAVEMFRNFYRKDQDGATLRRYLAAPLAIRARVQMEQMLKELCA